MLIHAFRGHDVVAGQFQHGGGGGLLLGHDPADDIGRGISLVALELRRDHALLRLHTRQTGILLHHAGSVGVHEAHQVGIERHLAVAIIRQVAVEIAGQGNQLVLRNGTGHRVAVLIQHIAF